MITDITSWRFRHSSKAYFPIDTQIVLTF